MSVTAARTRLVRLCFFLQYELGTSMTDLSVSRSETQGVFGANLRVLASQYPSVSGLCRQLGMNRTQFNRYLSGQNFPRPEVLERICRFFGVDARILLQPLDEITQTHPHPAAEMLDRFLVPKEKPTLASGFYQLLADAPEAHATTHHSLVHIRHVGHTTLLRGYEPRGSTSAHSPQGREVQGMVVATQTSLLILMSRRNAQDQRMMVFSRATEDEEWSGTLSKMSHGSSLTPQQLKLRYLGRLVSTALPIARLSRG